MFDDIAIRRALNERAETNQQRTAIARLATACESIIERGLLDADEELALRVMTNEVCTAFNMVLVKDRGVLREEETCA